MGTYDYRADFDHALVKTSELGFNCPPVELSDGERYFDIFKSEGAIDPNSLGKLPHLILEYNRALGKRIDVQFNCFGICLELYTILNEIGIESYLTVGYLNTAQGRTFFIDDNIIKDQLRNQSFECKGHCWLTLPTLEIVDPTFVFSFIAKNPQLQLNPEEDLIIVTKHWEDLQEGLEYKPVVVGSDYLLRGGVTKALFFNL